MIEGVRLSFDGVSVDGDTLDTEHVTLAVTNDDGAGALAEFTLKDGTTWMVDVAALDRALDFAKAEERLRRARNDEDDHAE